MYAREREKSCSSRGQGRRRAMAWQAGWRGAGSLRWRSRYIWTSSCVRNTRLLILPAALSLSLFLSVVPFKIHRAHLSTVSTRGDPSGPRSRAVESRAA